MYLVMLCECGSRAFSSGRDHFVGFEEIIDLLIKIAWVR